MSKLLNFSQVKKQSETVFKQFGEKKWIPNAKENVQLKHQPAESLKNIGIGRVLVLAAMGESTEEHIETMKKYRDRFHLMVNDKLFGYFVERGLRPDYVMLCDASIPYRWLEKYRAQTTGVTLIATPYANTEWTKAWLGHRVFYVAEDAIGTERIFLDIFGNEMRIVPAASNVSNAMMAFMLGANNNQNINWAGYDRYLLTGYDYSWRPFTAGGDIKTGKYYAFEDPRPKRFYMNHRTLMDFNRDWVHTSENLLFSARWMMSYLAAFRPPVVNCSGRGLLDIPEKDTLENQLKKINSSARTVTAIKSHFNVAVAASRLLDEAKKNFEISREAIYAR